MNIIFSIQGGAGKCVMASAVCKAIKRKYPKDFLIVVSGYPELFINNHYVDKAFSFAGLSYFYQDYIEDKDVMAMVHDPYVETSFLHQNQHLIKTWCEMYDLPYEGDMPEIFLTKREIEHFHKNFNLDRPLMILQTNGGGDQNFKYSWARDMPSSTAIDIINHYKDRYLIAHIRRDDQTAYDNTAKATASFRELTALAMLSEKRLLIDSFMQHACASANLPSTVLWVANSPTVFGYDMHTNITANPFTNKPDIRQAYLTKFNIGGEPFEFPYNDEREIFDTEKIIMALEGEDVSSSCSNKIITPPIKIGNNIIGD